MIIKSEEIESTKIILRDYSDEPEGFYLVEVHYPHPGGAFCEVIGQKCASIAMVCADILDADQHFDRAVAAVQRVRELTQKMKSAQMN